VRLFVTIGCLLLASGVHAESTAGRIMVNGPTSLPAQQIDAVVARFQGSKLDLVGQQRLLVALNRLYQDAGHVSSGFVINQDTTDGVVQVQAVEGKLAGVEVVGGTRLKSSYLASRVTRRLDEHLQIDDVQRTLRWLQTDPNIHRLDAQLLPGERTGEAILRLDVDDSQRFSLGLVADNHRSPALGAEGATLLASARNLSGRGESVSFSAGLSDGSDALSARVEMPVSAQNVQVAAYYARSDSEIIESRFAALDIESQSETAGVSVGVPVMETASQRLIVSLALENKKSESSLFDIPFSFSPGAQEGKSETATAEVGLEWERRGSNSAVALRLGYRRGFHALGATEAHASDSTLAALNPTGADGKFGRWLLQGTWHANPATWLPLIPQQSRLVVQTTAQLAEDPLMALEKLAVGGARSVKGYRENTFVRDNGVFINTQLRLPLWNYRAEPHPLNLMVVPFVDVGWSWDERATAVGATNSSRKRRIASAGLGLEWRPLTGLYAQIFWAEPIDDNFSPGMMRRGDYDLQDDGIHFSVGYAYRF